MRSASRFMSSENESKTLAVINCSQVVTLAGPARPRVGAELRELGIVADGAMFVRDGRIEKVGNADDIKTLIDANTTVVDARTHPVFSGTRVEEFEERSKGATYQEIAARGGGIQSTVNATRGAYEEILAYESWRYS